MNGRRRPRPSTRRRQLTAAAAILVLGLVLLALAVRVTHAGQILPGVRVEGVGLGGLSEAPARLRLASLAREAAGEPLALHARGRRLTIVPARAGYAVDLRRTIARAMASGRDGPLGGLWTTVAGLLRHRDVALVEAVDRRRLEATVASLAGRLGSSSLAGELAIEPGTLAVSTTPPRSGSEVDRQALAARLAAALTRRPRATVEVPLRTRRVASRAAVGTIVAPGARFSLNATVGERTTAGGYVKAPFIADGRLEDSIGGGVSQFSTTLYNAAYFAGLQIDGHLPHSFFIDRYPAGREATLNFSDIDMTWTNDTRTPVLIRTSSDEGSVTVSLYGDNGGRRVSARSGERAPTDGGDFAITVTRVVRYGAGKVVRQPFTTRYDKPPTGE